MDTVKLRNGAEMPIPGYGVCRVSPPECEQGVKDAISVGYRLIDTARAYGNEQKGPSLFSSHRDPQTVKGFCNYGKGR